MKILNITCPPLPHFIIAGSAKYGELNSHPNRKSIGVFDFIYVKRGKLYISDDNKKYEVGENQYLILSPETSHVGYKNSPPSTMFYWLHFYTQGDYIESNNEITIDPIATVIHVDSFVKESPFMISLLKFGELIPIISEEVEGYLKTLSSINIDLQNEHISIDESELNSLLQQNIFINLLNTIKTSNQPPSELIDIPALVISYIKFNFNKKFTLKEMAQELNFHPNYITRVMKEKLSTTPMDYLINYRINYSKYLITHSHFSIKKVAIDSGFTSPAYFTKTFKSRTGMLPTEYRLKTNFP